MSPADSDRRCHGEAPTQHGSVPHKASRPEIGLRRSGSFGLSVASARGGAQHQQFMPSENRKHADAPTLE
jgi:hypothetical protein